MPGKQPGGKVRISQTAPAIISKTKNPATSEVKYFGLVRDLYLEDLDSSAKALEQVLADIQDPAEKNTEGVMNTQDLAIIDGIVDNDVIFEDIAILKGASLSTEEGGTLVNPRYRLADRISQFANFAGRGTPFMGPGPVKLSYQVPKEGDLLPGTVTAFSSAGIITASDSTYNTAGTATAISGKLEVGDFVGLYNSDGKKLYKVGATAAAKKEDKAIYKVTNVGSDTSITLSPTPPSSISGVTLKLRRVYSHTSPPPFFTEDIDSTKFNAPDHKPAQSDIDKSHRVGFLQNAGFIPTKEFEKWWEGEYNHDFRSVSDYGSDGDTAEASPSKFPIVKDGNLNFDLVASNSTQATNFGFRWDFFFKREYTSESFFQAVAQCNGQIRIDFWKHTGYDSDGKAQGSWETLLNSNDDKTFFRQISLEEEARNAFGKREYLVSGGPNYGNSTAVTNNADKIVVDYTHEYTDEEGNTKQAWDQYVPMVIRYWYGQDTVDNSSSPIPQEEAVISQYPPSIAIDLRKVDLPKLSPDAGAITVNGRDLFTYMNNYFGFVKFVWVAADSRWAATSLSGNGGAYESNLNEFNQVFEVLAYSNINESSIPLSNNARNLASWKASKLLFAVQPDAVITGSRYDDGSTISNTSATISFPAAVPTTNGDIVYALIQNRPRDVVPADPATSTEYEKSGSQLWSGQMHNPDVFGGYTGISDLLAGGTNFFEQDVVRKEFASNPEYFKYKLGQKPALNTYGPDRYDGFIKNRLSTTNVDYDIDTNHSTVLPIGRQKKGTVAEIGTTAPMAGKDLATGETRTIGENYTFVSVEEDESGNGGEISLLGYPVNSMAAFSNTAGQENGGKILHGLDNTQTFGNGNRQNITGIQIIELPTDATYSNPFATTKLSMRFTTVAGLSIFYPIQTGGSGSAITEVFGSATRGLISKDFLGASKRLTAQKSIFIASYDKSGVDKYFHDLLLGTRPNGTASVEILASGSEYTIISSALFGNQAGAFDDTIGNRYYNGALIEVYADTDALSNSGTTFGTANPVATLLVKEYDSGTEQVTCVVDSGTVPTGSGKAIRVYYNYFQVSAAPSKVTNSAGASENISLVVESTNNAVMQIKYVLSSTYSFSRVDTGAGLSFAETLYSKAGTGSDPINPYSGGQELPSPPSVIVTPFDYDKPATDPANPGLGGLCYPPYETQDITLTATQKTDSQLYSSTEGEFDVYFGSPQVSEINLGNKFLKINDELSLDFSPGERQYILPTTVANGLPSSFPTFVNDSYTHKLSVLLSPDIAGLFNRTGYSGVNPNIFKDALLYSNNKPVKEQYYMFAKKNTGAGEQPISIITDNDPGWS